MIYFLLGISFLLGPSVFSASNTLDNAELVSTAFTGRVIFTKWCGPGNDAKSYEDLGENVEIDKCCRRHDHCELFVKSGVTKYGIPNDGLFTMSDCNCDNDLRVCLQNTNWVGDLVARIFAFTNKRCLVNVCKLPFVRCPRGKDNVQMVVVSSRVFDGIEEANDNEAINQMIVNGLKSEQTKKLSENERSSNHQLESEMWYRYPIQLQRIDNLPMGAAQRNHYPPIPIPPQQWPYNICCKDQNQL